MTRECHVRFCERLGVKFPRPTELELYDKSDAAGSPRTPLTRFAESLQRAPRHLHSLSRRSFAGFPPRWGQITGEPSS